MSEYAEHGIACHQPEEPRVVWYTPVALPKSTKLVFEDHELYGLICDFCRCMMNLKISPEGRVTQTLCQSCRTLIGRHASNACTGGTIECVGYRYVDEVGVIAPLCRGCHRYEERTRRTRRSKQPRPAATIGNFVVVK